MSAPRLVRTAAVFLIAVALIYAVTLGVAAYFERTFSDASATHVDREVQRIRAQILKIEGSLDANNARIAGALQRNSSLNRPQLFSILDDQVHHLGGLGMRIVDRDGRVLAWWGEDLRVDGTLSYQFDVVDLYIIRTLTLPTGVRVQAFERVVNQPLVHSIFDPDDDWIASTIFHGGGLRAEAGVKRYLVESRPDSSRYLDVTVLIGSSWRPPAQPFYP